MRQTTRAVSPEAGTVHVFCPIYEPHPGGGGTYFPLLARFLARTAKTYVYTERHPKHRMLQSDGLLNVWRVFMRRDTLPHKSFVNSASRYVVNSVLFCLLLARIACLRGPGTVVFTRNYHKHYLAALRILKWMRPQLMLVNDIRTEFPPSLAHLDLSFFDLSLSNALSTEHQMARHPSLRGRTHAHLKNMVNMPDPRATVKPDLDVQTSGFVLFCGTLSLRKSIDIVVPVMRELYRLKKLIPVVIGRPADHDERWLVEQLPNVPYIYREHLPNLELVWLEQHAALVLLPSRLEGLPRVAIETLSFHGHIVLPPCCPEFSDGLTVETLSFDTVLANALKRLQQEYTGYDVSQHDPETGLDAYRSLLERTHPVHRQHVL